MTPPLPAPLYPRVLKPVFLALCILPFLLLPLLSLNSGISGDEPVHYAHAEKVCRYFQSGGKDTSALFTPETNLKYYGQSFDNLSYRINRLIRPKNPYTVRHLLNSLTGALTILFAALIAVEFSGYPAGILTILFLLLSPVFLGHTYNNLKDIPFALGYVVAIYYLALFIRILPRMRTRYLTGVAVGTGLAFSVRAGGLFLFPVILFFVIFQAWLVRPKPPKSQVRYWTVLCGLLLYTLLMAWAIGLTDWPWGRLDPIGNPIQALGVMTDYTVNLRQLFEGTLFWSDALPWYYALKYLLITTPLVILAGLPFSFLLSPSSFKTSPFSFFLLPFAFLFPLLWILIRDSNLYGGIRHLLFIYPVVAVLAAIGWNAILAILKPRLIRLSAVVVLSAGLVPPLIHVIRNHPVEYVYFNEIAGGAVKNSVRYEHDYYFHSLGPAVRWLNREILSRSGSDSLRIASNFPLDPYLLPGKTQFIPVYIPWHERGCANWDYGLFVNTGFAPSQLRTGIWPPPGTIHTIRVDDWPVCAIVKRVTNLDFFGYQYFIEGKFRDAKKALDQALRVEPGNETALLYLGWTLRRSGDYSRSVEMAEKLLALHPESETARELIIWNYLDTRQFEKALICAEALQLANFRFEPASRLLQAARDSLRGMTGAR